MTTYFCKPTVRVISLFLIGIALQACRTAPKQTSSPVALEMTDSTPLIEAANASQLGVMEKLVKAGKDINEGNSQGITPLMVSARKCNLKSLEWLLAHDANTEKTDAESSGALHFAVLGNCPKAIPILSAKEAPLDSPDGFDLTPLMLAARFSSVEMVHALIKAGAKIDAQDSHGWSALHFAVVRGQSEMVDAFIDRNANLELVTDEQQTPLMVAVKEKKTSIAKMLLAAGANADAQDENGKSIRQLVVQLGLTKELSEIAQ